MILVPPASASASPPSPCPASSSPHASCQLLLRAGERRGIRGGDTRRGLAISRGDTCPEANCSPHALIAPASPSLPLPLPPAAPANAPGTAPAPVLAVATGGPLPRASSANSAFSSSAALFFVAGKPSFTVLRPTSAGREEAMRGAERVAMGERARGGWARRGPRMMRPPALTAPPRPSLPLPSLRA